MWTSYGLIRTIGPRVHQRCAFNLDHEQLDRMITVFLVHPSNLPGVASSLDDIVIELVPQSCCGKFGAWDM